VNSSEERRRFLTDCMQALSHVPGVTGIGFGMRFTNGELLQEKCIQVYVPRKMMRSELSNRAVVPPAIDGFPTDVIVQESRVSPFKVCWMSGGLECGERRVTLAAGVDGSDDGSAT